jgi:pimeloyl-ACP methyl ester carboxylesterase
MRTPGSRHHHFGPDYAQTRVVFVHGFNGDARKTWGLFPTLLVSDPNLAALQVTSWGYESNVLGCPGIETVAEQLITELGTSCGSFGRIIVVAHSLGGLVLLRALTQELVNARALLKPMDRIERIALFATPLDGTLVRRVIRGLISGPVGLIARKVFRNRQLIDLYRDELVSSIRNDVINRVYLIDPGARSADRRHIGIHAFVADDDRVVTETAARAWFQVPAPRRIQDTDHSSIKMPLSLADPRYRVLRDVIEDVLMPWFKNLCKRAMGARSEGASASFWELQRAYMHGLQQRLEAVKKGAGRWNLGRKTREQRKLLTLALLQSKYDSRHSVGDLLNDALLAYRLMKS